MFFSNIHLYAVFLSSSLLVGYCWIWIGFDSMDGEFSIVQLQFPRLLFLRRCPLCKWGTYLLLSYSLFILYPYLIQIIWFPSFSIQFEAFVKKYLNNNNNNNNNDKDNDNNDSSSNNNRNIRATVRDLWLHIQLFTSHLQQQQQKNNHKKTPPPSLFHFAG